MIPGADTQSADSAFRSVAWAAYEAFLNSPPRISYHLRGRETNRVLGSREVDYQIDYDAASATATGPATEDDADVLVGAAPNLDAVGVFQTVTHVDRGYAVFIAFAALPYKPVPATPSPHVDASVAASGAYVARFDPRDRANTTLLLTPTQAYASSHDGWFLSLVRFDPATMLPLAVELTEPDGVLQLRYQTVEGHPMVAHMFSRQTVPVYRRDNEHPATPPVRIGSDTVEWDLSYDQYTLPAPDATPPAANQGE